MKTSSSRAVLLRPPEAAVSRSVATTMQSVAGSPRNCDGCAYLFRVCSDLQNTVLDRYAADMLFDVAPGKLPETVCRTLAQLARDFVIDLVETAPSTPLNPIVALTLRRHGTTCAISLSDRGWRDYAEESQVGMTSVPSIAAQLNGDYQIRAMGSSRIITVTFDAHEPDSHRRARSGTPSSIAATPAYRAQARGRTSCTGDVP